MESYYSFLANVHKSWHGDINISYSPRYPDHSGVDNNTMTLSKAAFGPSGKLLGVMGIDIFENKVNEQFAPDFTFEDITKAATSEDGNQNLKDLGFDNHTNLTVSVCFEPSDPPLCPHPDTSGLCQEKRGNSKIGCCGKCNTKINWGKIVGIVAAGIVGFVVIAVIVYFIWRCITRKMEDERVLAESPRFTFPGPENGDTILQGDTRENSEPRTGG
ncbi:hypothetical protein M758_1G219000 [Ceratodon purpureus]|nr:hypothetical protein M758_1G219000 [Ceratodon purpureus]